MGYFSFSYLQHEDGYRRKSTDLLYYHGTGKEFEEMRKIIRDKLNEPDAVVTIYQVKEISKEEYFESVEKSSQK